MTMTSTSQALYPRRVNWTHARAISSSNGQPVASEGNGFAPLMSLNNGSLRTRRDGMPPLMMVATKSPESWLLPRSSSLSDTHSVKFVGKLPISWLLDRSSSTKVSHNRLKLSGISPENLFPAKFSLLKRQLQPTS